MTCKQYRSGVVTQVTPTELQVRIEQHSACSSCHAKGYCASTDCAERILRIPSPPNASYSEGNHVMVGGRATIGRIATLLAFGIPIILLLCSLCLCLLWLGTSQLLSIGISFGILGIYYLTLYILNPWLNRLLQLEVISKKEETSSQSHS